MSKHRLSLALLVMVTSCTARTPPPEADAVPQGGDDGVEGDYSGPRPAAPLDPCVTGIVVETHGWTVRIPVPCDPFWRDEGDPPPEALLARVHDRIDPATKPALPSPRAGVPVRAR